VTSEDNLDDHCDDIKNGTGLKMRLYGKRFMSGKVERNEGPV
jgi:hypothetical protein